MIQNNDDKYVLRTGQKLDLGKGYTLTPKHIDAEGKDVLLEFSKDGKLIDDELVHKGDTWTYTCEVDGFYNTELLKVYVSEVCQIDTVEIEGIWLMSDEAAKQIKIGDEFGELYVSDIAECSLTFKNKNIINLDAGSVIEIAEDLKIRVTDTPDTDIRFYPFITHTISNEPRAIEIIPETISLLEGDSYLLNAEILDSNGNALNATINWSSSNTTVGTIGKDTGQFTALSAGNTTITATSGDIYANNIINVTEKPVTTNPPSTKSSGSSSGGAGSSGTSGESYANIEIKEVRQETVIRDSETSYEFNEDHNAVDNIRFTALRNSGKITTTIEVLKGTSSFAKGEPSGNVYQKMNIWVGKTGFSTPENIKDMTIGFRVEKSWIMENGIAESSIKMCRYNNDMWNQLPTKKLGENQKYIYFESETPGFSPFAITGNAEEETDLQNIGTSDQTIVSEQNVDIVNTDENNKNSASEDKNIPGLSFGSVVMLLACTALAVRKRS